MPQSIAYAIAADLPAVYGLYASYIGVWVYVFLGTSKDVTVGPTSIMSSLVSSAAGGDVAYAICLSLIAGIYMLIFGLCELGWIMWLISHPTLAGFTSAAAIKIAGGEIGDLTGIQDWSSDFVTVCQDCITRLDEVRWTDTCLGLSTLLILFLLWLVQQHAAKCFRAELEESGGLPTTRYYLWRAIWYVGLMRNIIVVILGGLLDYALYVDDENPFYIVGDIPAGLQSFDLSSFVLFETEWMDLLFDGLVIALIGLLEGLAIATAFGKKNRYEIDNSQEMVAIGTANVIGSFFLCYPVTGSFSRSSVQSESGSRTPFAGFYTGLIVVLCLLFLTSIFYYIPMAVLAAVIIFAVVFMVNFCVPVRMWRVRKLGTISWIVTFVCVLSLGVEYGIAIGVGFDLILVVAKNLRPTTHVHDMGEGVILVEPESGWNYLSVNYVKERTEEALYWERKRFLFSHSSTVTAIILDMSRFSELDITALEALKSLTEGCHTEKILLFSVGLSLELTEDCERFGVVIPNFKSTDDAVAAARREVRISMALQERMEAAASNHNLYPELPGEESSNPPRYGTFTDKTPPPPQPPPPPGAE